MALSTKAKKRLEVAMARRDEATEITDSIDSLLDTTISTATTLYVTTTGSDNNAGTEAQPFRTIQAAINSLNGKLLRNTVTIQVGLGSFDGFLIDLNLIKTTSAGRAVNVAGFNTIIDIVGTFTVPILTSGTVSGTGSASVVNLAGVLTDGTQSWTVDELKGKYVLSGSNYLPIVSNTATTLTVANSSFVGTSYSIWDIGTNIDSGEVYTSGTGPGSTVARIGISGTGATANSLEILIRRLAVAHVSTSSAAFTANGGCRSTLRNISIVKTSGGTGPSVSLSGTVAFNLDLSYVYRSDTTQALISLVAANQSVRTTSSYLRGGSVGISGATTAVGNGFIGSTTFESNTTGIVLNGSSFDCQLSSANRFLNCTTALQSGASSFATAPQLICGSTVTMFFSGCAVILSAQCGRASLGTCSGSGNTNGIVATVGARVQISNTAALGVSGNELSVDGVTGTLATMRSSSPRVFPLVPNPYGTYVYE